MQCNIIVNNDNNDRGNMDVHIHNNMDGYHIQADRVLYNTQIKKGMIQMQVFSRLILLYRRVNSHLYPSLAPDLLNVIVPKTARPPLNSTNA